MIDDGLQSFLLAPPFLKRMYQSGLGLKNVMVGILDLTLGPGLRAYS